MLDGNGAEKGLGHKIAGGVEDDGPPHAFGGMVGEFWVQSD